MTGCVPGKPNRALFAAIDRVTSLFDSSTGALWPSLLRTARDLIVESRDDYEGPSTTMALEKATQVVL
jgi:hypothetical protein